jgi:HD-GYP domain-containing protein (c-di-GMP phosphodiesterase class II)
MEGAIRSRRPRAVLATQAFLRSKTHHRLNAAVSLAAGLSAGVLVYRENKSRRLVERVAAATLETLLNAIQANDEETGMHVRRVAAYALVIGDEAGLEEHQCRAVERVALFHDIGKIHEALFDIVHDGKRLSREERRKIATHPRRGADVLAPLAAFYPELPAGVLAHHEHWDGSGYPRHLRGSRIPLEARVVSIADTFDALTHNRRYRRGRGIDAAIEVIRKGRGKQFDPALVDLVVTPRVVDRLARTHLDETRRHVFGRRSGSRERAPDVSFRWRSKNGV